MRPASRTAARNFPAAAASIGRGDLQRPVEAGHVEPSREPLVSGDERGPTASAAGVDADPVGHVEREEIAGRQERVDRFQADVVGVDEIGLGPAAGSDRAAVGLGPNVRRALPMIVCSRCDLFQTGAMSTPCRPAQDQGVQLGRPLPGEAVADAHGVLWQLHGMLLF